MFEVPEKMTEVNVRIKVKFFFINLKKIYNVKIIREKIMNMM
jgi:hypothetical protein